MNDNIKAYMDTMDEGEANIRLKGEIAKVVLVWALYFVARHFANRFMDKAIKNNIAKKTSSMLNSNHPTLRSVS